MDRADWIDIRTHPPTEADCPSGYVIVWHAYQRTMVVRYENYNSNPMFTHWQPVPVDGWISYAERLPTHEDGDVQQCVLIRYDEGEDEEDGIIVSGWHRYQRDRFCLAWQHTPPPPKDYLKYRNLF